MRQLMRFKTLHGRLVFWLTTICLIPLMVVTTLIYFHRVKTARAAFYDKLSAVSMLRLEQINSLLDDMAGDLFSLAADRELERAAQALGAGKKVDTAAALSTIRAYLKGHDKVAEIAIVSPEGLILLAGDPSRSGTMLVKPAAVTTALRENTAAFGEVFIEPGDFAPCMDIAIPIRSAGAKVALALRLDMRSSIYPILENRTGMGETGESLLVNHDVVAISELLRMPNALLKTRLKGRPAQLAAQGENGIIESVDYRGEPVLAAYVHVSRTGWGLVNKQDTAEIMAPLKNLLYATYGLSAFVAFLVCLFAFSLARAITRPLGTLSAAAAEIGAGNFGARAETDSTEELYTLADSFNGMAEVLQIQMESRTWISRISDKLMSTSGLDTFFPDLLPLFMQATGAKMATAYMEEATGDSFVPVHSIGADPARMRRFNRRHLEGELGVVLTAGGIGRYAPHDAAGGLTFVTSFGEIAPCEIVTLPITSGGSICAFISLAAEAPFSDLAREIVEQVLLPLSAGFSRVMAGEDIRRLAAELSEKNIELTQQSEELRHQTVELGQQSEELYRRNKALDQQKVQLEETTRLKSEFLSNMSHELRTPLNSVLALSRVLSVQTGQRLSEDERGYLAIIERNGRNLLSLINDILDLAKIESGKQDVSVDRFSIETLTGEVIDAVMPLARDKGITITCAPQGVIPHITSDMKRMRQILQNLLANAVKFTVDGGVTVTMKNASGTLVVVVTDTGIGIPAEHLHSIFEEFRQVDGSTSRSFEGTGLGLAIVRKTARLLGGDVEVTSEVGKGSTFTVQLPIDGRTAHAMSAIGEAAHMPAFDMMPLPQRRCVLVVDDDPDTVTMVAGHLAHAGYETVTALNGRDAVQMARSRRPYAITLDVMMPDMDGWEVMRHLKEDPRTRSIPVIIVSFAGDRETGVALGAVGIVAKPVTREDLLREFEKIAAAGFRSVLVVDDEEHDRFAIAAILKEAGLDVLLAENGERALELARQHHPDLISLDLIMPGLDGAAVLDRLRTDAETATIPVVIITSKDLDSDEMSRLSSGVSSILSKGDLSRDSLLQELELSLKKLGWRVPSAAAPAGSRLLIVEDSDAAVIQVRFALETAGFVVDSVSNGAAAIEYLGTHVPDGIVLDLMMPGVDGFAVLASLRSAPLTAAVPVMVMTAKTLTPGDNERLAGFGVRCVVQKGDVDQSELLARMYEALGIDRVFRNEPKRMTPVPHGEYRGNGSVLVVEDNPDNMASIKAVLGNRYPLLEARDGEQGLVLARDAFPSLILLDMQLPRMDGMTVLRELKNSTRTAAIPVVALTASAMRGDRERFIEAGCCEYLSKPYEIDDLEALVRRFTSGSGDAAQ